MTHVMSVGSMRRERRKLTVETSIEVTRRFRAGEAASALAAEYKVSPDHIRRVARNQRDETARSAFRDRVFHFRATVEEVAGFDQAIEGLGYPTRSAAFRGLLRNAQGIATVFRADLEGFARITWAIEKPAVNINQIARKVNRGALKLSGQDSATLADLLRINRQILDAVKMLDGRAFRASRFRSGRLLQMNDLYQALFGKSWTDDLAMAQRAKTEAGARQPRSYRSAGKASLRNVVKSAHGSRAAVFKRIRAGGCKGPRALAAQIAYVNDKAHAVFRSDGVMEPNGLTMTESEKQDLVDAWSANWRGSSKLGFTSHMLLSFPQGTNPGIVKAVAEDWTEHFFDKGLYGDRWQYMVAIHTDRDHPHAHIILNNRGEDHGTWFSCWEKGVMSGRPLMRKLRI